MAARLPGVIAALPPLPVIGVPIKSSFDGSGFIIGNRANAAWISY